ncbi:MAG: OmpH family outer membrane protein [bacterium]|nr:OmpH family outer membrane protein [bacterium]
MIKQTIVTAALFCCFTFVQAQKIAHLNLDSLISLMPETKVATEVANNYLKGLEQELVAMNSEFEAKYKEYQKNEAGMNDLLKKNKQEDLQQLQTRIQDFQRKAEIDFRQKQTELTAPIMEKAKKGIDLVAKEGSYKYVLDTSPGRTSVLFSEASDDVILTVKKKLDSMPAAIVPGAPASPSPTPTKTPVPAPKGK